MKNLNILIFAFAASTIVSSCTKEPSPNTEQLYDVIQASKHEDLKELSVTEIDNIEKSRSASFTITDLFEFLSEYGQTEPDYIVTWNGFFQGQSCNVAQWQYTGAPCDSVHWILYGDTIRNDVSLWFFNDSNPITGPCGFYTPPCNGAHEVKVRAYLQGSIYEGEAISWANQTGVDLPACDLQVQDATNSSGFEFGQAIEYEPYEFLVQSRFSYDLNKDHTVNIEDFFLFVADFE